MKTLEEIKEEYAKARGYDNFKILSFDTILDEDWTTIINDISHLYASEKSISDQKELQKRILENVRMKTKDNVHELSMMDDWSEIDKSTITDEKLLIR